MGDWDCHIYTIDTMFYKIDRDFPGGAVVGSLPANAGDMGLSPGLGGSHMPWSDWAHAPQLLSLRSGACEPQPLSPRATTTEARALWGPRSTTKRGHRNEKPVHCNEEWPPLTTTRGGPRAATKTQRSQK